MITMTFTLKNREKTLTNINIEECVKSFVDEFEEAENEIQSIKMVEESDDASEYFIISGKKSSKEWYDAIKKGMVGI